MNNFEWSAAYTDLCNEIEILEIRRDELKHELKLIQRRAYKAGPKTKLVASYSNMPGGSKAEISLPQMWGMVNELTETIEDINDILELKREAKRRMEKKMGEFNTLEYRVAFMRDVERKSLGKIATDLGYSYDWIAKISSRLKRVRVG